METTSHPSSPATAEPGPNASSRRARLVVVGFGMVGYKLLERLAALDALRRYDVTVIGEEAYPAYDRLRLTGWLEHRDAARIALATPGWTDDLGIRVVTGARVVSIAREWRAVNTADGAWIAYDRLVLATGSAPLVPPIPGADRDGVCVYRTIDDLENICRRAAAARAAIVVGGGLLGIEAADALRRMGLDVVLLEAAPWLLSRQLDAEAAALLEASVRETGVQTITGVRAARIEARGDRLALTVDGRPQPLVAGLIVMAAGVRPRSELARASGLDVSSESGGIVVDDTLRTTDPAIHAIGECVSHHGTVYGLAAPGFRMAATLAEILAGRPSRFRGYTPAVRLRLAGIDVWSLGDPRQSGSRLTWRGNGLHRQILLRGRRMLAAAAVGPWEELGFTQDTICRRQRLWPWQVQQFLQSGTFSGRSECYPVTRWPASATVCNCLEVTRGALGAARAGGGASVDDLIARTGASTVCGSCRPLLVELAGEAAAADARRGSAGLIAAGACAVVLALVFAAPAPIPLAASLRESGTADLLYRDGWWRQATGYASLACALAAGAAYSLRKRWRGAEPADIGRWRLAHGAAGALALIPLVAHTGLRMGTGFDRALIVAFLAAAALGGAAAAGMGQRHARLTFWLHLLAVWPLPILLAFHILSTYYF